MICQSLLSGTMTNIINLSLMHKMLPYNHFSVNQSNRLKNCSDLSQIKDTCFRL